MPSSLGGFRNTSTTIESSESGRTVCCHHGRLEATDEERTCECGCRMHVNANPVVSIRHLPHGGVLSALRLERSQFRCPKCGATRSQRIPFKAKGHMITEALHSYACGLLESGGYTNKQVAELTGLGKNTVKEIDKRRLRDKYTVDGERLIKPERQATRLGIDEFKLHDGHKYATHIIDFDTGRILWIQAGRKKQVVYDLIEHVGMEWMGKAQAVACDMNSDFQEAFQEKCPGLRIVFDRFHVVKNFNEKVVGEVRKDEQRRLIAEGDAEAAAALKRTKHILTSKRSTLQRKDREAQDGHVLRKGGKLFKSDEVRRKGGQEQRYNELLEENRALMTLDIVKEKLSEAYALRDEGRMSDAVADIVDVCDGSGNKHMQGFARMLNSHFDGIIAHATYDISSGKIEGINQRIKTIRRQGYGYPDDEYFFLKLFDMSRREYVRNPKSHKICD